MFFFNYKRHLQLSLAVSLQFLYQPLPAKVHTDDCHLTPVPPALRSQIQEPAYLSDQVISVDSSVQLLVTRQPCISTPSRFEMIIGRENPSPSILWKQHFSLDKKPYIVLDNSQVTGSRTSAGQNITIDDHYEHKTTVFLRTETVHGTFRVELRSLPGRSVENRSNDDDDELPDVILLNHFNLSEYDRKNNIIINLADFFQQSSRQKRQVIQANNTAGIQPDADSNIVNESVLGFGVSLIVPAGLLAWTFSSLKYPIQPNKLFGGLLIALRLASYGATAMTTAVADILIRVSYLGMGKPVPRFGLIPIPGIEKAKTDVLDWFYTIETITPAIKGDEGQP